MRKFEKVSNTPSYIEPTRADIGSAGYDLYSPIDVTIPSKEMVKIATNVKCQMPQDEVLMLFVRSSIGIKRCLMLANGTGIIDSTYYNNPDNEGNIICAMYNYGNEPQTIKAGERIVQGVFVKYGVVDDDKPLSNERVGGIGSSGR